MINFFPRLLLWIFHPLLMATLGIAILLYSSFYHAMVSPSLKTLILVEAFLGTVLLPSVLLLLKRKLLAHEVVTPQIFTSIQYLFTAFCYYFTFYLLSGISVAGMLKAYFLAGSLVLVLMSLLSMRYPVCVYTVGPGALVGLLLSLMLRLGMGELSLLYCVIAMAGFIGYAAIRLEKNNPAETYAGFIVGFGVLFCVVSFIK